MAKHNEGAAREAARRAKVATGEARPRSTREHPGYGLLVDPVARQSLDEGWSYAEALELQGRRAKGSGLANEGSWVFAELGRLADDGDAEAAVELARKASEQVTHLEQRRGAAIAGRDRAVAGLRRQGWSWVRIAREVGVSRQALMKRGRD